MFAAHAFVVHKCDTRYLLANRDAAGRQLEVVRVLAPRGLRRRADECPAVPAADGRVEGDRLPGSYINFYIAGDGEWFPSQSPKLLTPP
jgi:agmatine/peptidylarginine deiminase